MELNKWQTLGFKFFKWLLAFVIILVILTLFYLLFKLLVTGTPVSEELLTPYQFRNLLITYVSSCVTTLALIVALLKDEIRAFWSSPKIVIRPRDKGFLSEKINTTKNHIKAEYFYFPLVVYNEGSLPAKECSILLTELQYINSSGKRINLDISTVKELIWTGKQQAEVTVHANGAKVEVSLLEIRENDATTEEEGNEQPHKLIIGGFDASKDIKPQNGNKWKATFMIYSNSRKPKKFEFEITWDGLWHNRLSELKTNSVSINI